MSGLGPFIKAISWDKTAPPLKGSRQVGRSRRVAARARMVERSLNSSGLFAKKGMSPHRISVSSRSPVSRLWRMTG